MRSTAAAVPRAEPPPSQRRAELPPPCLLRCATSAPCWLPQEAPPEAAMLCTAPTCPAPSSTTLRTAGGRRARPPLCPTHASTACRCPPERTRTEKKTGRKNENVRNFNSKLPSQYLTDLNETLTIDTQPLDLTDTRRRSQKDQLCIENRVKNQTSRTEIWGKTQTPPHLTPLE